MEVFAIAMVAMGQISQARAESSAAEFNAQIAEMEARATARSGAFEETTLTKQSEIEQAKIAREKRKTTSAQRAAYATAGVRLGVGSPLEVMADTATQYELDLATERYNLSTGLTRIRIGTATGIGRAETSATASRLLAKQKKEAGYYQAAGTILTGASSLAKSASAGSGS